MLFDDVIQIIINRCTAYNSNLNSAVHNLPVNIKTRRFILNHCTCIFKCLQIFLCLLIHFIRIFICAERQINLCPVNMKKGKGIAANHLPCFLTAHNIIRQCGNKCLISLCRSECFKCSENCHNFMLLPVFSSYFFHI